jgi:hypothetical protein
LKSCTTFTFQLGESYLLYELWKAEISRLFQLEKGIAKK